MKTLALFMMVSVNVLWLLYPLHGTLISDGSRLQSSSAKYGLETYPVMSSAEWNQTYGGGDDDWAYSIVQTSDGGYALAGYTNSYGAGENDFWLVKTDGSGNHQWNQTYGGIYDDWAYSIVQTSDGGYATAGRTRSFGAGTHDFWLVKTDGSGNHQWNQTYGGGSGEGAFSVVQTADGGYALAGYTDSYGAGESDFWLVKTDGSGNHQWNQTYGGGKYEWAYSIVQTSDGGYALAGYTDSYGAGESDLWLVKTDGSGNHQWNQTYGGIYDDWAYSIVQTSDGGYATAGGTRSFGAPESDFWLVKTDANGNMQWNQTYQGGATDSANSVVQTVDGGYALAGYTLAFTDFWLVKTDSVGSMQWNERYGPDSGSEWAESVVQTVDGGYALAGYTFSYGAGGRDFWLVKASAPVLYDVTINAYCFTESAYVSVSITMDGAPTGYNTPQTFTDLWDSHTFTVPDTDPNGHPFLIWSTGETSTTVIVSGEGTYTAYYETVVGGIMEPIDRLGLLAPHIGLTSTITVAAVAAAIYVRHVKRREERE